MKKTILKFGRPALAITLALIMTDVVACATGPATTTTTTPARPPTITITSPPGHLFAPGDVTVTVQVTDFTLVDKLGAAKVPGQGHIHYFMDVIPPTTAGQPAVTAPGTYAATAATSYVWHNVPSGTHTFYAELVNNDHTPLVPSIVATVSVLITPEIGPPNIIIISPRDGAVLPAGDITVTVQATNFNLVDKLGQPNAAREGHIHYFLDVTPPTTPGQPAVTAPGTYAPAAATSHTWHNVGPGTHTLSVELVNNDHTPAVPPVVASVTVTVTGTLAPTTTTTTPPYPY